MQLDSGFEDNYREAVLDKMEQQLREEADEAVEQAREALRDFADQYNVQPLIDALEGPFIDRTRDRVTVRWRCPHPAAGYFEFGTPDHYTIDGNPVLSYVWEDPPAEIREEFDREGDGWRVFFASNDSGEGIEETRFMRWSLRWLRWQLEA
jgi:hypothetical protein